MTERLEASGRGATLAVRVDGEAGKPWLLLSNSLAADMSMWEPQIAAFTRTRRVVRYDTRGHGGSTVPQPPYALDDLVADAVAVLDRLDIGTTDVVGLSLGGVVALGLGLAHPGRVSRLACCCARASYPPEAMAAWDRRAEQAARDGVASLADETVARWFTPEALAARPQLGVQARRMMAATSREGYVGCVAALQSAGMMERLPQLGRPTLFVAGERDGAAPPAVMSAMAEATPGARFAVVAGAAHIASMENPDAFNGAVLPFLEGVA